MFIGSVLIYILKKWTRKRRKATWCCSKCNKSGSRSFYRTDPVPFAKVRNSFQVPFAKVRTVSKYK